jgi:hypothetical protein
VRSSPFCGREPQQRAHEDFVAPGEHVFMARSPGAGLRDVVLFRWDMVTTADGAAVGGGTEILLLDGDGRIAADYQFVDP